ncbi:MAG: butyrate kinase [Candidatus Riflebacteria bacterium HGW-Riflebacteria-2]|jgi:butyrate kinase|nr:MAG: butyrate kinase [Candidatus Riflebacteria bacterium HGW-Riflebacteria-2]
MNEKLILVINPGSTSTKIALFNGLEPLKEIDITHQASELAEFSSNLEQLAFRFAAVENALKDWNCQPSDLKAVIGRGGPLKPLSGGVYHVGASLMQDLQSGKLVDHASILGGLIACRVADAAKIPAYIADPVSVDEFEDIARISGWPELPRLSLSHALNIKAVVAEVAAEAGRKPEDMNYIVAHLGGGFSIAAHQKGRQIDVNNANDAGPFSPERCGTLPLTGLLKMACSGKFTFNQLKKMLIGKGGLVAYLGTSDCREVAKRIDAGDAKAKLVLEAMAYQIAKEIGAMATVMKGRVDAIILTGGVAHNPKVVPWIRERVEFIAPVIVKPGQNELKALAAHACRALADASVVKEY